jgi:hypothetical protein
MDIFEKQQTVEAIMTIIKARWFYVFLIVFQAVIMKLAFPGVPLPSNFLILVVVAGVLFGNFCYWLYLRRPAEKINSHILGFIKFSQVPLEQFGLAAILYFSGTANKLILMMFIIPVMVSSYLFRTKGVIMATLSTIFLYTGLVILEYFGLMPNISPEANSQSSLKLLKGESGLIKGQLIGFNLYILAAAVYAGYLAGLFKRREKKLELQKKELIGKTEKLVYQTRELSQAGDYLNEALTKSDSARIELEHTKAKLEKTNTELKAKIKELEKYEEVTTGRELKMIELKNEINNLRETVENLKGQSVSNK